MDQVTQPPPADQLLALPADEGSRRVALALLASTVATRGRLDDPDDRTALHDFRVALRRLRTWLRAHEPYLGASLRRKHRRRLRDISTLAGVCRDNEVHIAWIRDVEESLRSRERSGGEWLLRQVVARQRETEREFRALLAEVFGRTTDAMADDLAVYDRRIDLRDPTPPRTFGDAAAPLLLTEAAALGERLAAVESIQDQAVAHAARLSAKRLRYLLEPISAAVEGGQPLVKRLRHLQDTIGEMHDVHIMAEEVVEAAERAGAEQTRRVATALLEGDADTEATRQAQARDPRPGLLAIASQLRRRGEAAFAELRSQWLGEHAHELTDQARHIATRLSGTAGDAARAPSDTKRDARSDVEVPVPVTRPSAPSHTGPSGIAPSPATTHHRVAPPAAPPPATDTRRAAQPVAASTADVRRAVPPTAPPPTDSRRAAPPSAAQSPDRRPPPAPESPPR